MDIYKINTIKELTRDPYVGRGNIAGLSEDGRSAVAAYFIMGRSANSRNRVFAEHGGAVFTEPFDASKVEDPSLIIYAAVREIGRKLIVTNGDQTDTIVEGIRLGSDFSGALRTREFEPDAPNLTPRISAELDFSDGFNYKMSILKSEDEKGSQCARYTFEYAPIAGLGHFIHTYVGDGNPLPTFQGEPERVAIPNSVEEFSRDIWESLNEDNKISLFVRYTDIRTGGVNQKIINKYVK